MKLIEGLKNEITEILEILFQEEVPFRSARGEWNEEKERGGKKGKRKRNHGRWN